MKKFWIGVACHNHVQRGLKEGICQVCHGKAGPLKIMQEGDFIIYYSPTFEFGVKVPHRHFTAIGQITARSLYQHETFWRRAVAYFKAQEAAIEPLIPQLEFIKDKAKWGFPFRRGCFTISKDDFLLIAHAMGVTLDGELF